MNQEVAGLPGNSWWVCLDLESDDSCSIMSILDMKHQEQFIEWLLLCVRSKAYMKRREIRCQNKKSESG